jgi:putative oxidoreductase
MNTVAVILEILLGLLFIMSGFSKVAGVKMQVDSFTKLGYPQWFRVLIGLLQIIGAAGFIIGIWTQSIGAWAGIGIGIIMLGAVVTHIRAKDPVGAVSVPFVLMVLALAVTFIHSSELSNLF